MLFRKNHVLLTPQESESVEMMKNSPDPFARTLADLIEQSNADDLRYIKKRWKNYFIVYSKKPSRKQ